MPYSSKVVPTEYGTSTVKIAVPDAEGPRANSFFVGATLWITAGPGQGLSSIISAYSSDGTATVSFSTQSCGLQAPCVPKGSTDPGYAYFSSPSAYVLSQYEIRVVDSVSSYSTSRAMSFAQALPMTIPATYAPCVTYDDQSRICITYSSVLVAVPVKLEWVSGGWCGEAGGMGWGATSPCVANGLIVTTSSNRFVYGLGTDGTVKWKYRTGKRIKAPPRSSSAPPLAFLDLCAYSPARLCPSVLHSACVRYCISVCIRYSQAMPKCVAFQERGCGGLSI